MLKNNFSGKELECGADEAGRGCLAGPVVASAVILPKDFHHPLLNDSKQLTEKQRIELRPIIEKEAISYAVSFINPKEIDEINILNASIKAMQIAISKLNQVPEFIIVDGNRFKKYEEIPHQTIVKGDSKYTSIAAASILAKTYRDEYMETIHEDFPYYLWAKNKGYPTKEHRNAIMQYGSCIHHRESFRLIETQLSLDL